MRPNAPRSPLRERERLQVAIIINQLATPGLGSWIAGHRLAGAGQLALACAGCVLFTTYFALLVTEAWRAIDLIEEPASPAPFWWQSGMLLLGVAWVWAGITSLQLYARIRRAKSPEQPPRLP